MTPPPRSAAERGPGTASGRALVEGYAAGDWHPDDLNDLTAAILAIEAEAAAGTEDAPMHTDEKYIEYGVVQYRRGRAQAEAEAGATAATPLDVERLAGAIRAFCDLPATLNRENLQEFAEQTAIVYARLAAARAALPAEGTE